MRADSVFTDWGGSHAPLSIGYAGLANIQNSVFRNMHLFSEIVDVSFGGAVRFENVSLANVTLEHNAVVSTSGNDYNTNPPSRFVYDAYDDFGYDVQVVAVPEGRRGEFGEEYRIVEDVMSDCLYLLAPQGLLLPGCPEAFGRGCDPGRLITCGLLPGQTEFLRQRHSNRMRPQMTVMMQLTRIINTILSLMM